MSEAEGIIIGAVIGGLFGTIGALLTHHVAERQRVDALFASALEYLGGGSQRRNLGIAAIALYWQEFPNYTRLCAELLVGSAIYLLAESGQEDAAHELFNLNRIMDLLKEISPKLDDHGPYKRLEAVVDHRIATIESKPKPKKGLWVEKSDLVRWKGMLETGKST